MKNKVKLLFLLLLLFINLQLNGQVIKNQYIQQIDSLLSDNFFNSTIASVKIYNLSTSEVLYEKNGKLLLRPASNLKLFTTAAGLIFLGGDYKFKTTGYYTGQILNNTLYGDVYIKGGFDPFFKVEDLDKLLIGLKQLKINKITGDIFADVSAKDSLFWGKGWMWDDDPDPSAPYLTSLNINENSVDIITEPSPKGSQSKVTFYPESNYYSATSNVLSIAGDSTKIKITRDWINRNNDISVTGYQNFKDDIDSSKVNIFRPELFFINLFKEKLKKHSIEFRGKLDTLSTPKSAVEFSIVKRGIDSVIIKTNKESNNLGAEMILQALAEKYYGNPATAENGLKLIDSLITLIGDNPEDFRIVDGSGVSHYNLISTNLVVDLLKYFHNQKEELFKLYYSSLPIAGVDGTLDKRMINEPALENVHGKTGTLSGVSNLSGYLTSAKGDKITYSIFMQNFVGSSKYARSIQDSLCTILSLYK